MSRRKKNLRAFLHQNPTPTIEDAWDAAWDGAQKHYHSKTMNKLEAENKRIKDGWDAVDEANRNLNAMLRDEKAENKALREAVSNLMSGMDDYPPSLGQKWLVESDDIEALAKLLEDKND